ncbi:hypothetical protein OJJOAM_002251 [Cupriavidus sp. H18C1]
MTARSKHAALEQAAAKAAAWLRQHAGQQSGQQSGHTARLTGDTRRLRQGDVFFAYVLGNQRLSTDGRPYIGEALARGAAAVVYESRGYEWPHGDAVPHLPIEGLERLAGPIAAAWYGNAARGLAITGITGTNGKTSCSQWLARVLQATGTCCATIGTLGSGFPDALQHTGFTTPDAVQLQDSLAELHAAGAAAVAMEVSSHGLEQGRVAGTPFQVAVLTNLTQDHLDYHGSMAEYEAAKTLLFHWPKLQAAVINRDDAMGRRLLAGGMAARQVIEYGIGGPAGPTGFSGGAAWLRATGVTATPTGTVFKVDGSFGSAEVATPLIGEFNVSNLLAVLGAALANGVGWDAALAALRALRPVDGRMELFGGHEGPLAVVDYAHTPRRAGEDAECAASGGGGAPRPAVVRVRLRRRSRSGQASADGRGGRAPGRRGGADQRQPAQRGPAGDPRCDRRRHAGLPPRPPDRGPRRGHPLRGQACRRERRGAGGRQGPRGHAGNPGPQAAVLRSRACAPGAGGARSIGMSTSMSTGMTAMAQPEQTMTDLQQAAGWIAGARIEGDGARRFTRVHTDSRTVEPGDLFVALRGERFDAHDFIADVAAKAPPRCWSSATSAPRRRVCRRSSRRIRASRWASSAPAGARNSRCRRSR